MDTKSIFKWAAAAVVIVLGTIYFASVLLISDKVVSLIDFRGKDKQSFKLVQIGEPSTASSVCANIDKESLVSSKEDTKENSPDANKPRVQESSRLSFRIESEQQSANLLASIVFCLIKFIVVAVLFLVPIGVVYVFLVCPIRDIPLVEPLVIQQLTDADVQTREEAGSVIAQAMWDAESCPEEDRDMLQSALERPAEIDKTVKELLEKREQAARKKALEIAAMAGLTVAVSSSSIGDGFGMFVWKSRLVYETFRIYGFRPNARTVVSIWAHVVFASFFAASIEELCELFDVSEFVGGIGVRVIQGGAGAAMVLKGGSLTRKYLTNGVSSESRRQALAEFKATLKDDVRGAFGMVRDFKHKAGYED